LAGHVSIRGLDQLLSCASLRQIASTPACRSGEDGHIHGLQCSFRFSELLFRGFPVSARRQYSSPKKRCHRIAPRRLSRHPARPPLTAPALGRSWAQTCGSGYGTAAVAASACKLLIFMAGARGLETWTSCV